MARLASVPTSALVAYGGGGGAGRAASRSRRRSKPERIQSTRKKPPPTKFPKIQAKVPMGAPITSSATETRPNRIPTAPSAPKSDDHCFISAPPHRLHHRLREDQEAGDDDAEVRHVPGRDQALHELLEVIRAGEVAERARGPGAERPEHAPPERASVRRPEIGPEGEHPEHHEEHEADEEGDRLAAREGGRS